MLDNGTKRLIDSARDILVGKVPDPKGQIEHITIALIYKFMDDMDTETIHKFHGKAKFFTGEYEKYSWRKLFDPKLGGHDMLALYREAIEKMYLNPNIPDLFKSIFKNAYLTFNSPETLKMFLKTINEFNYEHSENLGNAYEYLLSVLGTQGDAGQFRTPRHIIEFIVSCVDPQKHESILDPACGTAGFILSSYKHILRNNAKTHDGDKLTPDERKRIAENLVGFDIDPNMVRFSLVNMFLHKFQTPHIYEYDTLSSEDRWNEYYDVIVANPPFMTPKGGIKPHKRFSIQATKSEVLFTDYMAEHLAPNGRAGIIVPNGIIATTQTAYKSLRKMLVENYLVAVVSLPAGVFNPYSGVKTSILLLDKKLSKKADSILFIKVENDGYDLGAQRREIDKNDLPKALSIFNDYKTSILSNTEFTADEKCIATLVKKEKIFENKDVNLSADRYLVRKGFQTEFDKVKLVDVLDYEQPTNYIVNSVDYDNSYKIPVLTAGKTFILGYTNEENGIFKDDLPVIIFDDFTTATQFVDFPFKVKSSAMKILKTKKDIADIRYLYYVIQKIEFNASEHKRYWISEFSQLEIPLPPIEIQQEIVSEIESYQKIIDGARMVVENYKPIIKINHEWEMVELGSVCDVQSGGTPSSDNKNYWNGKIPWYSSGELNVLYTTASNKLITDEGLNNSNAKIFEKGSLLVGMYDTAAFKMSILDRNAAFNQAICGIKQNKKVNLFFLYLYFLMMRDEYLKFRTGARQRNLSKDFIVKIQIPIPPIKEQTAIVSQIEEEQKTIEANKKLMQLFEQKIKDRIAEVWGEKE